MSGILRATDGHTWPRRSWRRALRGLANLRGNCSRPGQFIFGRQVAAFECEFGGCFRTPNTRSRWDPELRLSSFVCAPLDWGTAGLRCLAPALTSPFTAQAILGAGCKLRFTDVDEINLLLDPARIGKRTRAIVPVHLYGQPYDFSKLPRGPVVVQDACQAHGAGRFTEDSPFVAYSFYPTKNLPCCRPGERRGCATSGSKRTADSTAATARWRPPRRSSEPYRGRPFASG